MSLQRDLQQDINGLLAALCGVVALECAVGESAYPIHFTALYSELDIGGTRIAAYELDLRPEDVFKQVRINISVGVPSFSPNDELSIQHILPALHF